MIEISLFKGSITVSGNRYDCIIDRGNLCLRELLHIIQIHNIAAMTAAESVFRRKPSAVFAVKKDFSWLKVFRKSPCVTIMS